MLVLLMGVLSVVQATNNYAEAGAEGLKCGDQWNPDDTQGHVAWRHWDQLTMCLVFRDFPAPTAQSPQNTVYKKVMFKTKMDKFSVL